MVMRKGGRAGICDENWDILLRVPIIHLLLSSQHLIFPFDSKDDYYEPNTCFFRSTRRRYEQSGTVLLRSVRQLFEGILCEVWR